MTKQEEIREGMAGLIHPSGRVVLGETWTTDILQYLHSQGVVIKVDRELPYKWEVVTREHSYRPYKKFTTYTLSNKYGKMFGYVQKYQSLTGYKCFEKPIHYCIYLGDREYAHSDKSFPTLKESKGNLLEQFLASKDNPDNEIPAGYVAVEPLVKEEI